MIITQFIPFAATPISTQAVDASAVAEAAIANQIQESLEVSSTLPVLEPVSTASIVELSPQGQLLSANPADPIALGNAQRSEIATSMLDDMGLFTANAQAGLMQQIDDTQYSALSAAEQESLTTSLQSVIADTALSEAVVSNAASALVAASTVADAAALETATAVANATAQAQIQTQAQMQVAVDEAASENAALSAAVVAEEIEPVFSMTNPAVAAAVAAYHVSDGLISDNEDNAGLNAPPIGGDVAVVGEVKADKLDLYGDAPNNTGNGITWNWARVMPIKSPFARRR